MNMIRKARSRVLTNGTMLIDASLAIRDLNEDYGFDIEESNEYDTIGGFIISNLQRLPAVGDNYNTETKKFTIVAMKGRRILKLKAEPVTVPQEKVNTISYLDCSLLGQRKERIKLSRYPPKHLQLST